ncbi:TrlF family AAA-like ATPase [Arthrobacter sp. NPDC057009]|uniref:TrlF family AAA-like ATPase n=1 Tax=Arthrobacter sp. NPDC057009 TaxID=3345996 RepID=UPI003627A98A
MSLFPGGSEWRKWDLHLHLPGTKLADGYTPREGMPDWDRFCVALEESDVAVFGITDYFALADTLALIEFFKRKYPRSTKTLLPNLELRLNESVNREGEEVNVHVIFPENLDSGTASRFMSHLKTELIAAGGRRRACSELENKSDYESATVSRESLEEAVRATFGTDIDRQEHLLVITSCKGDGIRPQRGARRKENLTDAIDQLSDGFFGASSSSEYFLQTDRMELPGSFVRPKPVFSGCDSHSFEQLGSRLGKTIEQADQRNEVTWIKADPTYAGLCQTLIEPKDRARIQPHKPDAKEPYQVISRVRFPGSSDFPDEIVLNSNLTSIIGSRSSGKSALLAYISHAVDADYTVDQQMATGQYQKREDTGPAAGKKWTDMGTTGCEVQWEDPAVQKGKVIYIPQNSLYALSGRPSEITAKIKPALHRLDPSFEIAHKKALSEVATCNSHIELAVSKWFELRKEIDQVQQTIHDFGDKAAITSQRQNLEGRIKLLREQSSLSVEETNLYQKVLNHMADIEQDIAVYEEEQRALAPFISSGESEDTAAESLIVRIELNQPLSKLPQALASDVQILVDDVREPLQMAVNTALAAYADTTRSKLVALNGSLQELKLENAELIAKNGKNTELEVIVQSLKKQDALLNLISVQEENLNRLKDEQASELDKISTATSARLEHLQGLKQQFEGKMPVLDDIELDLEIGHEQERLDTLSQDFNQRSNHYVDKETGAIHLDLIRSETGDFLEALASGRQKIKQGRSHREVASNVLTVTEEIRFLACLDGDRIGGFAPSSMTPGKQGLFALTLILNQSQEAWPLLIDQPEDDLDSRSIYQHIVPYLNKRKTGRQIVMVTHNANLVLGADSELVIVANRHGDDRKNHASRTFDYLGGSLEHSIPKRQHDFVLSTSGIREHACEILDGGAEAFRKRKDKYRV